MVDLSCPNRPLAILPLIALGLCVTGTETTALGTNAFNSPTQCGRNWRATAIHATSPRSFPVRPKLCMSLHDEQQRHRRLANGFGLLHPYRFRGSQLSASSPAAGFIETTPALEDILKTLWQDVPSLHPRERLVCAYHLPATQKPAPKSFVFVLPNTAAVSAVVQTTTVPAARHLSRWRRGLDLNEFGRARVMLLLAASLYGTYPVMLRVLFSLSANGGGSGIALPPIFIVAARGPSPPCSHQRINVVAKRRIAANPAKPPPTRNETPSLHSFRRATKCSHASPLYCGARADTPRAATAPSVVPVTARRFT